MKTEIHRDDCSGLTYTKFGDFHLHTATVTDDEA